MFGRVGGGGECCWVEVRVCGGVYVGMGGLVGLRFFVVYTVNDGVRWWSLWIVAINHSFTLRICMFQNLPQWTLTLPIIVVDQCEACRCSPFLGLRSFETAMCVSSVPELAILLCSGLWIPFVQHAW